MSQYKGKFTNDMKEPLLEEGTSNPKPKCRGCIPKMFCQPTKRTHDPNPTEETSQNSQPLTLQKIGLLKTLAKCKIAKSKSIVGKVYRHDFLTEGAIATSVTRDGRYVAYATGNNIKIFRFQDYTHVKTIATEHAVRTIEFTTDSKMIGYGGEDQKITIVSLETFEAVFTVHAKSNVDAIDFSDDLMIYSGEGGSVVFYDRHRWHKVGSIHIGQTIRMARFSPDGKRVAFGGWDNEVTVVDAATRRQLAKISVGANVRCISFSYHGLYLAYGGWDNKVTVVETFSWSPVKVVYTSSPPYALSFSPDDAMMAYGGQNKMVTVVGTGTWEVLHEVPVPSTLRDVHFGEHRLLSFCGDFGSSVMKTGTWCALHHHNVDADLRTVHFSRDNQMIVFGGEDRKISVLNAHTWEQIQVLGSNLDGSVYQCQFSKSMLAVISTGDAISILRIKDWSPIHSLRPTSQPWALCFSHHEKWLAYGGSDKTVTIVDTKTWKTIKVLNVGQEVYSVSFSPDNKTLAYGYGVGKNTMTVVDMETYQPIHEVNTGFSVYVSQFSSTGKYLVIAGLDCKVTILNTTTWTEEMFFDSSRPIRVVDFSSTDNLIAFAGEDGRVFIYDTRDWRLQKSVFVGHYVWALSFSPDDSMLAYGGKDAFVTVLDIAAQPPPHPEQPTVPEVLAYAGLAPERLEMYLEENGVPHAWSAPSHVYDHPVLPLLILFGYTELAISLCRRMPELAHMFIRDAASNPFQVALDKREWAVVEALLIACKDGLHPAAPIPFDLFQIFKSAPHIMQPVLDELKLLPTISDITQADVDQEVLQPRGTANALHIWQDYSIPGGIAVETKRSPWPNMARLDLLKILADENDSDLFSGKVMECIVNTMWDTYCFPYFIAHFALYSCFSLCIIAMAAIVSQGDPNAVSLYVVSPIAALFAMVFLMWRGMQMKHFRLDFFKNIFFVSDMFVSIMTILVVAYEILYDSEDMIRAMTGLIVVFVLANALQFLRGISFTSSLVKMLTAMCVDMLPFLSLLGLILLGWTGCLFVMMKGQDDYATFSVTLYTVLRMCVFGDVDVGPFDSSAAPLLTKLLFILFMFLITVVMLNAVIAIMGNSLSRISDAGKSSITLVKAEIMIEYLYVLPAEMIRSIEADSKWVHILQPRCTDDEEWLGELSAVKTFISRRLETVESGMGGEMKKLQKTVDGLSDTMATLVDQLARIEAATSPGNNTRRMSRTAGQ